MNIAALSSAKVLTRTYEPYCIIILNITTKHTHLTHTSIPPNKLHITIQFACDIQNKSQSKHRCPQIRKKPQKTQQKILKFYTHMHTSISHHLHNYPHRYFHIHANTTSHALIHHFHTTGHIETPFRCFKQTSTKL